MRDLLQSPRYQAVLLLEQLDRTKETLAGLLRAQIGVNERAFLSELLYGSVRFRRYLNFVLSHYLKKSPDRLPVAMIYTLHVALYQMLFLDHIPIYATIWEAVETVKQRSGSSLAKVVNGVLRSVERAISRFRWAPLRVDSGPFDLETLAIHYALPTWWVARLARVFDGSELLHTLAFLAERPEQVCRVNRRLQAREVVIDGLRHHFGDARVREDAELDMAFSVVGSRVKFDTRDQCDAHHAPDDETLFAANRTQKLDRTHPLYLDGSISFQSRSSQFVVKALATLIKPQMSILDACSGAGGKSLALAETFGEACRYVAYDPKVRVRQDLEREKARLGLPFVHVRDDPPTVALYPDGFDLVLVDAPCSGMGTLQKNPELRMRQAETDLSRYADGQRVILSQYAPLVAPGGILVYSVCSTEVEENELVIDSFLNQNNNFKFEEVLEARTWCSGARIVDNGYKMYPFDVKSEGFFISLLRRTCV